MISCVETDTDTIFFYGKLKIVCFPSSFCPYRVLVHDTIFLNGKLKIV